VNADAVAAGQPFMPASASARPVPSGRTRYFGRGESVQTAAKYSRTSGCSERAPGAGNGSAQPHRGQTVGSRGRCAMLEAWS
jgi:hypothetical protein